jgi:hypothetical protein
MISIASYINDIDNPNCYLIIKSITSHHLPILLISPSSNQRIHTIILTISLCKFSLLVLLIHPPIVRRYKLINRINSVTYQTRTISFPHVYINQHLSRSQSILVIKDSFDPIIIQRNHFG